MLKKFFHRMALKSPFWSSFYYSFINKSFQREYYSVIKGKETFESSNDKGLSYSSTLNRNIHRLEKGLIVPVRKDIFAGEYIYKTVKAFKYEVANNNDYLQLKWAFDVLEEYFKVVKQDEKIKKAYNLFKTINYTLPAELDKKFLPFKYSELEKSNISYDEFIKLCSQRRSIRWYKEDEVPASLARKAIEAALLSPSACNRQPLRFIFINNKKQLEIMKNLPMGTRVFADNIPAMMFLIGDLSAYSDERDRHLIYIDGGLMAMSFMQALETLGLSSCPINWPDMDDREEKLSKLLSLKPYERCVMCFTMGYPYPDSPVLYSQRKSIDKVFGENNVYTD